MSTVIGQIAELQNVCGGQNYTEEFLRVMLHNYKDKNDIFELCARERGFEFEVLCEIKGSGLDWLPHPQGVLLGYCAESQLGMSVDTIKFNDEVVYEGKFSCIPNSPWEKFFTIIYKENERGTALSALGWGYDYLFGEQQEEV